MGPGPGLELNYRDQKLLVPGLGPRGTLAEDDPFFWPCIQGYCFKEYFVF